MPSSITLTVSHLPTSTSFFLAALQPLGYAYRGRSGQTIGFGPENSKAPADFWITQEVPGVPAGAAHVAFPAVSHTAVQDFFTASLRAGGKIYGEPATRDQYGYYSAAVIDFDGNSIEAVYRPGFGEENKENDARSVVSHRTASRAPTVVSRAPTTISKSGSAAPSQAPTAASRKSQSPKGDALDRILNEARNTANVARELVDQVRPNLNSLHSSPTTSQKSNNGSGDAIVGTLLGVAAGAALHYAFNNRNVSNSDPEDRGRRPSVNRCNTSPNFHDRSHVQPYAIEAPPSTVSRCGAGDRYITMEDNDYASTIRPTSRTHPRRGSIDSGIGLSPPSNASKSSRKSGMKMLEAPPSSYRAPTVLTSATTQVSQKSKRSSSQSRASSASQSRHSRRRSSAGEADAKTVLHIRESIRRVDTFPPSDHSTTSRRTSKSRASTVKPENRPLPPSRAATWANGGQSEASFATARSNKKSVKTGMGKMGVNSEASAKQRDLTKSVVGKVKGTKKLDLPADELGPEDSVSQVSSVRPSSKRSSRR